MAEPLNKQEAQALDDRFHQAGPQEVLVWALERFGDRIALSSSFGAEDVALIHMLHLIDPNARVFTLDTLRLPTETYGVIDQIRERYKTNLEVMYPDLGAIDKMTREWGYNCFYNSVEE